ncbi:hypothetical protein M433DRAFT_71194 [Acidomyces richmondensis BFW]|nr:MAG: hypothetical protein FE78DRAFT_153626 [Acidomyces sp. 'richmondensis']KYG43636.1 hypothetical protein M433DRAFT_71194 [Acidomyces richmondensis BFW]
MCPNIGAAYLYIVLFGLTAIAHVVQMFWHRKWYCWVIVVSAGMQTAAYTMRTLSIRFVTNSGYYTYWFVLMMIAPIWTNAFAYMVCGRMVYNFTEKGSVFKMKAWNFGLIFVLLDIFAFFIQVIGAVIASIQTSNTKLPMIGIHIYMGGIGFQQLCIFLFLALAARLHMRLRVQPPSCERHTAFTCLWVLYVVVLLITIRIIFRLIEYSSGIQSSIPLHEEYQYIFDSTLMLLALVLFNVFHPGRMMPGKESKWPKRKERKAMRKAGEMPHGRAGEYLLPGKDGNQSPEPTDMEMGQVHYARDFTTREGNIGY